MGRPVDMVGKVFGNLTVVRQDGLKNNSVAWECKCTCGNVRTISGDSLRRGNSTSCGCQRNRDKITHGLSDSPEYAVWRAMRSRCNNVNDPAFKDYGARGITVCPQWDSSFESFISDIGRRPSDSHTLERVDNDKGYSPGNCKWDTRSRQASNRRNTRMIEIDGVKMTLSDAVERTGIKYATLYKRHIRASELRQ